MNNVNYLKRANDCFILANTLDEKGTTEAARKEYTRAINYYDIAIKLEPTESRKADIASKRTACHEKLKECAKKQPPQSSSDDEDDSDDDRGEKNRHEKTKTDDQYSKFKADIMNAMSTPTDITFDSVAGLEDAKRIFRQTFVFPEKFPSYYENGAQRWKSMLLYGPPGTGKTRLAKAAACENKKNFFSISSSDLISKYVGESEKYIKALFLAAAENAPCIVFVDEIDSMVTTRSDSDSDSASKVKTQFLIELNEAKDDVFFMCATNFPWNIDEAFLRRMENHVYIPLPDKKARVEIIRGRLTKVKHSLADDDINEIADKLEGFSGADIELLVKRVLMKPLTLLENAQYFRIMENGKLVPLDSSALNLLDDLPANVVQKTWKDVTKDEIDDHTLIDIKLFMSCVKDAKPSVKQETVEKYNNFLIMKK